MKKSAIPEIEEIDVLISAKKTGTPLDEDKYWRSSYNFLRTNRPSYAGESLQETIEKEKVRLLGEFPEEGKLIEGFLSHAIACYNIIQEHNQYRPQLGKGQLRNVCLLLDRSPELKEMSPPLQTEILRIRQRLLYQSVMGDFRTNEHLR